LSCVRCVKSFVVSSFTNKVVDKKRAKERVLDSHN
jgi:hypothetical protein